MTCDLVNVGLAVMNGVLAVNERTVLPCSGLARLTTVRTTVGVVLRSCAPQATCPRTVAVLSYKQSRQH